MAKAKKTLEDNFAQIAKETDGDILGDIDSIKFHIDMGSLPANYVCSGRFIGGGIPGGRIVEIFGPESSGKSLIASNIIHGCQMLGGIPVLLDTENAANRDFMSKVSKVNTSRLLRYTPETLERCFRKMHVVIKRLRKDYGPDIPIVIIYDSISVSPCERELRENDLPDGYKAADWKKIVGRQEQPGEAAKIIGGELRKIQTVLEKENVSLVILNQLRDKIGVLYGSPETTARGGNAIKFYASLRLRTAAKKKIENKKLNKFAGINLQVKNIKNRAFRPFVIAEDIKLFFDCGIDPLAGMLTCLIEDERVVPVGKGRYAVAQKYLPDGKTEYKFTATKADNRVDEQVFLDCPALIDATSAEEIKEYLEDFRSGMAASRSDDFMEKAVAFDIDGNPVDGVEEEVEEDEDIVEELEEDEE